jgi:hypothetical protein
MTTLRVLAILSWIALPTVMFGGYSLLRLLTRGNRLSPFQITYFRAGHAHAGVLLLMSLLYYLFMEHTTLTPTLQVAAASVLFVGILAQSGGFFLHMGIGKPERPSLGTTVTTVGAILLASAVLVLVYGLITAP